MLFTVNTDRMADRHRRVKMGITPIISGVPKSCMGTAARSAMIRDRTSSDGSNSPICRLPMRRMPTMIKRYRMMVRMTAVITGLSPFCAATLCPSVSQGKHNYTRENPTAGLVFPPGKG